MINSWDRPWPTQTRSPVKQVHTTAVYAAATTQGPTQASRASTGPKNQEEEGEKKTPFATDPDHDVANQHHNMWESASPGVRYTRVQQNISSRPDIPTSMRGDSLN